MAKNADANPTPTPTEGKVRKARKPAGPKYGYILYKGDVESMVFTRRTDNLVDLITGDRDLKVYKIELSAKP